MIKEYKEWIENIDKQMDEMSSKKMTKKEREEYDRLNDLRYDLAKTLKTIQLEAKIKRLEDKIKRLEASK